MPHISPPRMGEPYLLTPGPLTTAHEVKAAMLCDHGSWDGDFRAISAEIRTRLLAMLGDPGFDCVLMQGSGSFVVESMLGTFIPCDGRALVLANGAYGQRAAAALRVMGRSVEVLDKGDFAPPRGAEIARILADDPGLTHVVAIHCETSSGILNPLEEIAQAVAGAGRRLLVDAMSSFGGLPIDTAQVPCDALVSSANKCIEGVPGFGFILARRDMLEASGGNAHSLALDAHAQWAEMERSGQWRYTPPTHVVAAFLEALRLHAAEGGVAARTTRYSANRDRLVTGMRGLGFATLLSDEWLSPIITTFHAPADPAFDFVRFYDAMKRRGFIIYPGKLTRAESFRLGHIGQVDTRIMGQVVDAVAACMTEMGVRDCKPAPAAIQKGAIT
ncbi:2-aminoethylphosphonate--pyruvate transaminase [Aquicoccus sp.]|uniref:2-aminoethylphosphonate--pyruvate transaminase n=2 Tax=Aquicoccus sp. TaxID=2055851 RepID=UPI003564AA28